MFSIEYKQSIGCAGMHNWHKDAVDLYILYKDNEKIYSPRRDWEGYYFIIQINHSDREITMTKRGDIYDIIFNNDYERGRYAIRLEDCEFFIDDLLIYIEELKELLNIQEYRVRLYA